MGAADTAFSISHRAFARVGLLGNPSDGYYGKTISFSIQNFYAQVSLTSSDVIRFVPHPLHDVVEFKSLASLAKRVQSEGYYGGARLLLSICNRFFNYCDTNRIDLEDKAFTLSYDTNIPRQAGLAGSSAIICAALRCLIDYYHVDSKIPVDNRPSLILSAEADLGIAAGLQDRVIQVYGGLVYMDFDKAHFEKLGWGVYVPMDPNLLPKLYLIYCSNPSDSGKVHSDVRRRWLDGEELVREKMSAVAGIAEEGKGAIEARDVQALARLMDRNFKLRREMFGDSVLGETNLQMVAAAHSVGAAAKFTGSGGAIVALCPDGDEQAHRLMSACQEQNFTCIELHVAPANVRHDA